MPKDFYKIWVFPLKNMGLPREEFVGIKVSLLQGSKLTFCLGASCQLTEKFWSPDRKFWSPTYCCGATEGSEQQHNQDLKEIYKGVTKLKKPKMDVILTIRFKITAEIEITKHTFCVLLCRPGRVSAF